MYRSVLWVSLLLFSINIHAQIELTYIEVSGGFIQTNQAVWNNKYVDHFVLYPEVSLGGTVFEKNLEWNLFINFWDDGVDNSAHEGCTHPPFTFNSYGAGLKLYYLPEYYFFAIHGLKFSVVGGGSFNILNVWTNNTFSGKEHFHTHEHFQPYFGILLLYELSDGYRINVETGISPNFGDYGVGHSQALLGMQYLFSVNSADNKKCGGVK